MKTVFRPIAVLALACLCGAPVVAQEAAPTALLGLWCGKIALGSAALQIDPAGSADKLKVQVQALGRKKDYEATVQGNVATVPTSKGEVGMALQLQEGRLRIIETRESLSLLQGESLTRASGASCPA